MKYSGIVIVILTMIGAFGCKSKERGVDAVSEQPASRSERGPNLGLPIRIIDAPPQNWVTIDSLSSDASKQTSIGNIYLTRVSRVLYKSQYGYLVEGDFPDGCSSLHSVELAFDGDTVTINARSKRDPSSMCTQALVPFSYFATVGDDTAFELAKRWKSGDTSATIE